MPIDRGTAHLQTRVKPLQSQWLIALIFMCKEKRPRGAGSTMSPVPSPLILIHTAGARLLAVA